MTRLLPAVLHARQLPLPELCAARLDGEVYAIDECYAPIDEVEGTVSRADALREIVGDRAIAECESALWIYGILGKPPSTHTVCVPRTDRATVRRMGRVLVRETRLQPGDTRQIAGLGVTTPLRTAFDLLRSASFEAAGRTSLLNLLEQFDVEVEACRVRIEAVHHLPGRTEALRRLDDLHRPT